MVTAFRAFRLLGLISILLLFNACATSRGEMSLRVPAGAAGPSNGQTAVILAVSDQREFQEDPRDPSIPSLKKGEKFELDAEGRKRAVARKRNSYGMALGDIMLEGGDTVETLTRDLVASGLRERGYQVLEAGEAAPAGAMRLNVGIKEFWAWFSPGFWAVSMEAKLLIQIDAEGPGGRQSFAVPGYGINKAGAATEANWILAYDRAFEDYLEKQRVAFAEGGL